jgi:transposase
VGAALSCDRKCSPETDRRIPAEGDQGEHRDWLLERCRARDLTLRGLIVELAERGLKVGYRSVWTFVHAAGLSYKKHGAAARLGQARRAVAEQDAVWPLEHNDLPHRSAA